MDDIEAFSAEREQHMNLPDEDVDADIRARSQDFHRKRDLAIDHTFHTQSHSPDDHRKADASWHTSGVFRTSAEAEPQISDEGAPRQLKRKSAEHDPPAQEKKPRLHDTSPKSLLHPVLSRTNNVERFTKIASPISQLAAYQKGHAPFETNTLNQDPDCGPLDTTLAVNSQSLNNDPSAKNPLAAKLPVAGSRSHITKPTVNHEENLMNIKNLPSGTISQCTTAQTCESRIVSFAAHNATGPQETTSGNNQARLSLSKHNERTSVEDERLPSFTQELGISSPQSESLQPQAADTRNIPSPSTSPDGLRHSKNPRSLPSGTEGTESSSRPTVVKPSKVRKTLISSRSKADTSKQNKGQKTKGNPVLITPLDYAQKLQLNFDLGRKRKTDYLRGKHILYVGGDMQYASTTTRGRMDYIVKHGGTLVPSYDPTTVTHIVTDAMARPTLRALGLRSLNEIPDHIPTVTWSWVISGYGRSGGYNKGKHSEEPITTKGKAKAVDDDENYLDFEFLHAAFHERIDAGRSWQNRGRGEKVEAEGQASTSANELAEDLSRISSFTQDKETENQPAMPKLVVLPSAPLYFLPTDKASSTALHADHQSSRHTRNPQSNTEDPLAQFYEIAKAERDQARILGRTEPDDSDEGEEFPKQNSVQAPRRGFTCDRRQPQQDECVNQDIIDKLEELKELHKAKLGDEDRWRVYSYSKCIRALRNYPKKIKSFNEARSINGVGEKTAQKIMEIIETGRLRRINYEKTDDVAAINLFQGIYGVGRQISSMWYNNGCRSLDDIRARKGDIKLSPVQEIGLRFYDDINSRMPRSEVESIFKFIKPIALALDEHLYIDIMGSFRRGKTTCGDIDILITRPTSDGMTHAGVLPELLARLHAANILTEDLALPDDFSALELCYRGLCKLPELDAKRRRIDILCVPWQNRGAALLYYTGDDIFNRAMRMKANVLGYSLNQRGLYGGVVRDPRNRRIKVNAGSIVASETEEEIFKILGVPWQEPHERVRG